MQQTDDFGHHKACRAHPNNGRRDRLTGEVTSAAAVVAELPIARILPRDPLMVRGKFGFLLRARVRPQLFRGARVRQRMWLMVSRFLRGRPAVYSNWPVSAHMGSTLLVAITLPQHHYRQRITIRNRLNEHSRIIFATN